MGTVIPSDIFQQKLDFIFVGMQGVTELQNSCWSPRDQQIIEESKKILYSQLDTLETIEKCIPYQEQNKVK